MINVKVLLTKILNKLTVTTPTISITDTLGTITEVGIRQYGNVVTMKITTQRSTSTASGANYYEGTINTTSLRPPFMVTSGTFYGGYSLPATIDLDGNIRIRNANSASLAAVTGTNNTVTVSFTYIVE